MNLKYVYASIFLINSVFGDHTISNGHQQHESYLQQKNSTVNISRTVAESNIRPRKWISELMDKARGEFNMDAAETKKCKEDFQLYKLHLRNQSIWAVRMLESSEWPSTGIYAGITYNLGNYDECLLVSEYGVKGKYCLVNVIYSEKEKAKNFNEFEWPDERASVWDALNKYQSMPWTVSRQNLHWAMCIPESCESTDVALSLNRILQPIFEAEQFQAHANVDPKLCSTKKSLSFPYGFYNFCGYIVFVLILVVLGTMYNYFSADTTEKSGNKAEPANIFGLTKCFSLIYNLKQLTRRSSDSSTVHFIKICYLVGVLWGHRSLVHLGNPTFNREEVEMETVTQDHVSFSLRTIFVIDIFIIMSGFFCYYQDFTKIKKLGISFAAVNVFIRWTRLVPILIVIMLFVINVLPYLNDGPYWDYRIRKEVDNCVQTFWYNVLGVGNQLGSDKTCIYVSWYVSLDLQLTVIGSILLILISKSKKLGFFVTVTLFIASTLASSIVAYVRKYHSLLPAYGHFFERPTQHEEFHSFYVATYQRLPFYLMGFGTGIITRYLKKRNYKSSNIEIFSVIIGALFVKTFTLFYVAQLFDFVEPYDRVKSAWNIHLPRIFCFIPDCYAIILCFTSNIGFAAKLFEYHIWTVIGRLMYCFFIVHIVLQLFHSTSLQVLAPFTNTPMLWIFIADIVLSLTAALILHLLVEAPIMNFVKLILSTIYGNPKPDSTQEKPATSTENTIHLSEKN